MQNVMQALYLTRNARGLPASARRYNSPYEDFMKEKSYFKGVPPSLPPKGSRCDGCPYWHGIGCMFCYREQLTPKAGGKNEP